MSWHTTIEYTVPDEPYRFVVMPRMIVPISSNGHYLAAGETSTTTTWRFK